MSATMTRGRLLDVVTWLRAHPRPGIYLRQVDLPGIHSKFIERHKDGPFFLYLSHYAVHTRLNGKPELVAEFEKKSGAGKGPKASRNNPHLAAQLKIIDEGLGMIVKKLDELGLSDKTVLIFTGDNGGGKRGDKQCAASSG